MIRHAGNNITFCLHGLRAHGSASCRGVQGGSKEGQFYDSPCFDVRHCCKVPFFTLCSQETLGEGIEGSIKMAQFNKLMQLFPQPDRGKPPDRQMRRLPTLSYADDTFYRKSWKGKLI